MIERPNAPIFGVDPAFLDWRPQGEKTPYIVATHKVQYVSPFSCLCFIYCVT